MRGVAAFLYQKHKAQKRKVLATKGRLTFVNYVPDFNFYDIISG